MPGMYFMSGFADDEYYTTTHDSVYDGSADMSAGVFGMLPENAGASAIEAILSCFTTTHYGWELAKSNASMATAAGQILNAIAGHNTHAADLTGANDAPAEPQSFVYRPFMLCVTLDVSAGANMLTYVNGVQVDSDANTGGIDPAEGSAINLGRSISASRAGTNWLLNKAFLASTILSANNIANFYRTWISGEYNLSVPIPLENLLDHVWYAEDAKRGSGLGGTATTWYSRPASGGAAPKLMTAVVDDGLRVDYYNVAASL